MFATDCADEHAENDMQDILLYSLAPIRSDLENVGQVLPGLVAVDMAFACGALSDTFHIGRMEGTEVGIGLERDPPYLAADQ